MPSSPSSPHRHHHLLVIIPTPPLPSSPPRTITSTHAKHHRDNLLEGASGGGNSTEGAFVSRVTATKGVFVFIVITEQGCVWVMCKSARGAFGCLQQPRVRMVVGFGCQNSREGTSGLGLKPKGKGAFGSGSPQRLRLGLSAGGVCLLCITAMGCLVDMQTPP
ncbi:hypothetical protein Tco_0484929 [Tanacetum coccineum]